MRGIILFLIIGIIGCDMYVHRDCVYTVASPVWTGDTIVPSHECESFELKAELGLLYVEKDVFGETEKFQASITNKKQVDFDIQKFILIVVSSILFYLAFILSQKLLYRSYEQRHIT